MAGEDTASILPKEGLAEAQSVLVEAAKLHKRLARLHRNTARRLLVAAEQVQAERLAAFGIVYVPVTADKEAQSGQEAHRKGGQPSRSTGQGR